MDYRKSRGVTYSPRRSSSLRRACLLLTTKEEDLRRPPRRLAKVLKLSLISPTAPFQPLSSDLVGRTSLGSLIKRMNLKKCKNGSVGMSLMRTPHGMETNPSANEMPHSRPPIRVTWNAAPPTKTITIWTTISTNERVSREVERRGGRREHTK